ncbi:MAG: hypothetical protein Q8P35_00920 [Candidatus Yanofskybacteria bacterium]|nr:hypothetical protein [Candidatus Yanofskybacteria bacterium]
MNDMNAALTHALENPRQVPQSQLKPPPAKKPVKRPAKSAPKSPAPVTDPKLASPVSTEPPSGVVNRVFPLPKFLERTVDEQEMVEQRKKFEVFIDKRIREAERMEDEIQTAMPHKVHLAAILLEKDAVGEEIVKRLAIRVKQSRSADGFDFLITGLFTRESTIDWLLMLSPFAGIWLGHLLRRLRSYELTERANQGLYPQADNGLADIPKEHYSRLHRFEQLDFDGIRTWVANGRNLIITNVEPSYLGLRTIFKAMARALSHPEAIARDNKKRDSALQAIRTKHSF